MTGALAVKRGTNPDSTGQPTGTFALKVYNAINALGENGLLVKNNWAAATSTVFEVGRDLFGGAYASYFKIDGTGQITVGTSFVATNLNADKVDGLDASAFVLESGDTMSGALTIGASGNALVVDTDTFVVDATNNRVGIGTASPGVDLHMQRTTNGPVQMKVYNPSTGTGAYEQMFFGESDTLNVSLVYLNSGFTASGTNTPNTGYLVTSNSATGGLVIRANANAPVKIATGGVASTNERLTIDGSGNVVIGNAALATNATAGFLYLPSCNGTPTGTPTTYSGRVPVVYDTAANKIWAYNGSWRSVALT